MSEFIFVGIIVILGCERTLLSLLRAAEGEAMNDLIFAGNRHSVFYRERALRALLRQALGGPHGNHRCRDHRAVALHLFVRGDDSARKILRNSTCKPSGWIQFALYFVALALITKPMGLYLLQVLDANGRTWLDPVLRPLERVTYRVMGVIRSKEHDWKQYTFAMLLFSLVGCLFTYAILRLQNILPLNPQGLGRE